MDAFILLVRLCLEYKAMQGGAESTVIVSEECNELCTKRSGSSAD